MSVNERSVAFPIINLANLKEVFEKYRPWIDSEAWADFAAHDLRNIITIIVAVSSRYQDCRDAIVEFRKSKLTKPAIDDWISFFNQNKHFLSKTTQLRVLLTFLPIAKAGFDFFLLLKSGYSKELEKAFELLACLTISLQDLLNMRLDGIICDNGGYDLGKVNLNGVEALVVYNLLANAVKYSLDNKAKFRYDGNSCVIENISRFPIPEVLGQRGSHPTSGTGYGLVIARLLSDLINAELSLSQDSDSQGMYTISFTFNPRRLDTKINY